MGAILGFFCCITSTYPCCIADDCESSKIEKTAEKQEDEKCGLCSPFISCGTCTGFIPSIDESLSEEIFQSVAFSKVFGLSFKCVEAEVFNRVWQPPKRVIIS